jgi:phosphatidate cytidylyltransferase
MLAWRLLSAAVGIPVIIALVLVGGPIYVAVLTALLAAAVAEVLAQASVSPQDPRLGSAAATAAVIILAAMAPPAWQAGAILLLFALTLAFWLVRFSTRAQGRWWLGVALSGYVGGLGRFLLLLRLLPHGSAWVLFALFVTFASDTGAYAVGRLCGRHRLAPAVSPGKTVEGAGGGLLTAALVAMLLALPLRLHLGALALAGFGLGLSSAAQAGDLFESALKRRLQIKDAGTLVPGHGGLLDRLDSLLFSGAMVYCVVKWMSL